LNSQKITHYFFGSSFLAKGQRDKMLRPFWLKAFVVFEGQKAFLSSLFFLLFDHSRCGVHQRSVYVCSPSLATLDELIKEETKEIGGPIKTEFKAYSPKRDHASSSEERNREPEYNSFSHFSRFDRISLQAFLYAVRLLPAVTAV
jgi:hypothetical protein